MPHNCDSRDDFHNKRNVITVANIFVSLSVINYDLHERILSIQSLKTSVTDVCVEPEAFIFLQQLKVCFLKKKKIKVLKRQLEIWKFWRPTHQAKK